MNKRDITATVGSERYRQASAAAYRAAPHTGTSAQTESFDSEIAHDIQELIWDAPVPDINKVALTFEVYADMPCYALLMGVSLNYCDLSAGACDLLWTHIRVLIGQDNEALSGPIEYTLWCDYFEGNDRIERAWAELTGDDANDTTLRRVLIMSGPVPFGLKSKLYARLIDDNRWHHYIFRSLLHSTFDYFGNVDKRQALTVLQQLDLPPDTENLVTLQHALLNKQ